MTDIFIFVHEDVEPENVFSMLYIKSATYGLISSSMVDRFIKKNELLILSLFLHSWSNLS